MNILLILLGNQNKASSRVRGYWMAEALTDRGHSVRIRHASRRLHYLPLLAESRNTDAIIFQKKYGRYDILAARLLRQMGKKVYFDIDDAPSRTQAAATLARAFTMMASSDGVFAGSQALAGLAQPHQNSVHVLPSGVLLKNYRLKAHQSGDQVCLGWIGNGAHYADDLIEILRQPLTLIGSRQPVKFRIVGACGVQKLYDVFGSIDGVTIDFLDQIAWSDPNAVAEAIAPIDIGLYPLAPQAFNDYKCAFKALEYMASGLPVVASSVGANAEVVIDAETGFLCQSSEDWERALMTLISDTDLRARFGLKGRQRVEQHYDVAQLAALLEVILGD